LEGELKMKLTTQRLKKLIREELSKLTEQETQVSITIIYQDEFGEAEINISEAKYETNQPITSIKNEYEDAVLYIEGVDVDGDNTEAEIDLIDVDDLDDFMNRHELEDFSEASKAQIKSMLEN